jgi:hypothetical protein
VNHGGGSCGSDKEYMKRRKAADVLGFRAELLEAEVEELAPSTLTVLFNKMWRSGEFLKEWKKGVLVPIRKGDGRVFNLTDYHHWAS